MVEPQYAPKFRDGWLDYLKTLNDIVTKPKYANTFMYSFFSWEDFFCLISYATAPEAARLRLSDQLGFKGYVRDNFSVEETKKIFGQKEKDISSFH